jgi:hypothetical protein
LAFSGYSGYFGVFSLQRIDAVVERPLSTQSGHSVLRLAFAMDIFRAMAVLIEYPLLALAPAAVFAALFALSKSRIAIAVGLLWFAYFPYEYAMKLRILCSGECNIRIDLLALYPILILASLAGVAMSAAAIWRKRET